MKKVAMGIFLFLGILICLGCNSLHIEACPSFFAMDTIVSITFYNEKEYQKHYQEIKKIYQEYDSFCSDYESNEKENSIYDLNTKRRIEAEDSLIELLKAALNLKEETKGYYNPFIGKLSHLWKEAIEEQKLPENEKIEEEVFNMENTFLEIEENKVTLSGNGDIDLGGIAKGFATEKVKEYLEANGVKWYLINAGDSNIVFSSKKNKDFVIGLMQPYASKEILYIQEHHKAIGTSSGKYQNFIVDGNRYHHLLNPFTGMPVNRYDNVNVMCNNSLYCDVYATAIFAMEIEDAKAFAVEKNIDILLFKDEEILYKTDGWKSYA